MSIHVIVHFFFVFFLSFAFLLCLSLYVGLLCV